MTRLKGWWLERSDLQRRLVGLAGLVIAVVVVTGATYGVTLQLVENDRGGTCKVEKPTGSAVVVSPGVLDVRLEQDTVLDFGRATGGGSLDMALEVLAEPDPPGLLDRTSVLAARVTTLRREGSHNELQLNDELSVGGSSANYIGDTLTLRWCVNRSPARPAGDWAPGVYTGDLVVDDARVEPLTVPVTMTLSHARPELAVMWLPIVGAGALLMTWNIRAKRDPNLIIFSNEFWIWLVSLEGVGSLAAGIVAMLAIFNSTYLTASVFGMTDWDWVVLIGALYVAFVGAASTIAIVAPNAPPKDTGRSDEDSLRDDAGGRGAEVEERGAAAAGGGLKPVDDAPVQPARRAGTGPAGLGLGGGGEQGPPRPRRRGGRRRRQG